MSGALPAGPGLAAAAGCEALDEKCVAVNSMRCPDESVGSQELFGGPSLMHYSTFEKQFPEPAGCSS